MHEWNKISRSGIYANTIELDGRKTDVRVKRRKFGEQPFLGKTISQANCPLVVSFLPCVSLSEYGGGAGEGRYWRKHDGS